VNSATVALTTLGCRLNQAEAEAWAGQLADAGYRVVGFAPGAAAYIVHTCTVTHVADRKSRQRLHQAQRYRPGGVIATGCLARRCPQEAFHAGASLVLTTTGGEHLVAALRRLVPPGRAAAPPRWPERRQAQVKAQEGCHLGCSYCIIPRVRGRPRSRPPQAVVAEVNARLSLGYQEVVITGTLLGSYGADLEPTLSLEALVRRLLEETTVERLRLSSLQPGDLTPGLLALWGSGRLVPHFHLPLQSGSDAVLRRMRRSYTVEDFCRAVARVRQAAPGAAITTDLLVGFPGETEEEFAQSLALCREIGFNRIHVFPYSPRPGTVAAHFPQRVPLPIIRERCRRAAQLGGSGAEAGAEPH